MHLRTRMTVIGSWIISTYDFFWPLLYNFINLTTLCQSFPFTVGIPCMKPTLLLFRRSHLALLGTHYSCGPERHGLENSLQFPGSFLRLLRVERHSISYNTFEGTINSSSKWVVTGIPKNQILISIIKYTDQKHEPDKRKTKHS